MKDLVLAIIGTMGIAALAMSMNNEQNKIMGIGLIKNHPVVGKYAVHSVQNYNRFVYIGKWRIDREDMSESELEYLKLLESVCFRGINHCIHYISTTIQPPPLKKGKIHVQF